MVSICHDQGLFSHSHLEVPSICMFHSVVPCCFHLNLWCLLSAFRRKSWVFSLLSWKDKRHLIAPLLLFIQHPYIFLISSLPYTIQMEAEVHFNAFGTQYFLLHMHVPPNNIWHWFAYC